MRAQIGLVLQIAGLIVAPIGLIHYIGQRDVLAESTLMTWELGCLAAGAALFLLGKRLGGGGGGE